MSKTQNLVLIPGLMLDQGMWEGQIAALSGRAETRVADRSKQETLAGVVAYILENSPDKFALAGLSQGGVIALEILQRAPERVSKLALLDTSHRPDTRQARKVRTDGIREAKAGRYRELVNNFLPRLVAAQNLKNQTLMAKLKAMALDLGPEGYIREQSQMLDRKGYEDFLPKIRIPAVVVCGREDSFFSPRAHQEMAAAIPGAKCRIIENAGHMSPMENRLPSTGC